MLQRSCASATLQNSAYRHLYLAVQGAYLFSTFICLLTFIYVLLTINSLVTFIINFCFFLLVQIWMDHQNMSEHVLCMVLYLVELGLDNHAQEEKEDEVSDSSSVS